MTYRQLRALAGAAFLAAAAPVQSATVIPAVFNFTTGSNYNVVDGNARIFSATSPDIGTIKVRATGWSLEKTSTGTYVRDSKLMVYSGGLGVISGDDDGGNYNQHTIDNEGRKDFVLLQFDRKVRFLSATFNTYSVLNGSKDSDAIFKYGNIASPWNGGLNLNNQNVTVLDAMFDGSFTSHVSFGSSNTRTINPGEFAGDFWLVGAAFKNPDYKIDGFKLTNLAVVPEPATWAMMISGFGLLGAALRRRRHRAPART